MKYRLATAALLLAVLGALAIVTSNDSPTDTVPPAAAPGADDAAMKSLNIN